MSLCSFAACNSQPPPPPQPPPQPTALAQMNGGVSVGTATSSTIGPAPIVLAASGGTTGAQMLQPLGIISASAVSAHRPPITLNR